jgi:hypothetical protein
VLPLAVLVLAALIVAALPFLSGAMLLGTRAAVQSAADAAAIAGAGQAIVARRVDARGNTYCETIAVDPAKGPLVASEYWVRNVSRLPILTRAFAALPSGRTLTVYATVVAPGAGLAVVGVSSITWTVTAEAELQPTSGVPTCLG